MKIQLLFSLLLVLSISVSAQKTGFSQFSSQSGVHVNNDGKSFIYAIGEPINNYSENADAQIRQGLLHSEVAAQESDRAVIQIRVFIDTNKNGEKEPDEKYITQGQIRVIGGLVHVFSNKDGINYFADPGTYSFEYIIENEIMGYTTTSLQEVEIVAGDAYKKVDFGIAPEEVIEVANIYFSLSAFRCFRPIENVMTVINRGGAKLQKTIYLEIDERIDNIIFDIQPDVIISDHLVGWDVCLEPSETASIPFTVQAPGVTSPTDIGEEYKLKAWVDLQNNLTEERTLKRRSWILRCSYDPNDKLVVPDRADSLALLEDELVYTVRFQNTGNDVADDVVVVDTLDSNLDMSTFSIINSSHPKQLEVLIDPDKDHIVNFQFKNIFLPDSTTNEPGSNGHITYRIKPIEGTPLNTEIENTAHIYFDFNPAIVTNTTSSTLVDTFPIPKEDIITEFTKIICAGESYDGYSTSGDYRDVYPLSSGYDSIRLLRLISLEPQIKSIQKQICEGDSFMGYDKTGFYRDTIESTSCGSITELDLVVYENQESYELVELCGDETYKGYKGSGIVVDNHSNSNGCDSIHVIEIIVRQEISDTVRQQICLGDAYEGYNETGIFQDQFTSSTGCDSVRILDLTVVNGIANSLEIEICQGEVYDGYDASGTYEDTYSAYSGCDSVRTLILEVNENISLDITKEICQGEIYEGYSETGTHVDYYTADNGCDSVRIIDLVVLETFSESLTAEICEGDVYEGYEEAGTYEDSFVANNGCDSTRILTLTLLEKSEKLIERELCQGESYEGYDATGIYEDSFTAQNGCDSIRTLELSVLNTISETFDIEICEGDRYEGYGAAGSYEDTFTGSNGCDSIRLVNIVLAENSESFEEIHLCIGEEYEGYEEEGLYTSRHFNAVGCDSLRNISIIKLDIDDPICAYEYDRKPKHFGDTQFLDLYPNPVKDIINLTIDKPERLPSQLEIFSVERKRVHLQEVTSRNTAIDMGQYANGVYIFILRSGNNIYIQRVLKS